MNPRFLIIVLPVTSWILFVAVMVWPAVALAGRCIVDGESPVGGFTFSSRQLGLLWRSVWLSGLATVLCLVVALPGAYVVGRVGRLSRRPLLTAMMMVLLLCPPMVYAFGWERLLPAAFNAHARCIGVWALWAWPIPATLIGAGWSRVAHGSHEAALLTTSPAGAFFRVALPALLRYVGLSALIVFILFFNDYGVPHACALLVFSTELLGWAVSSSRSIDTVWPSTLSVGVTALALLAMFAVWGRCAADEDAGNITALQHVRSRGLSLIAYGCFGVSWVLPMAALVVTISSPVVFVDAIRTYAADLAWSLGLGVLAGLTVVGMGLGLARTADFRVGQEINRLHEKPVARFFRRPALVWAVAFGALPGALIGESLVAAYNYPLTWWVYDHWPIVALSYVARFGWIGLLTAALVIERSTPDLVDQAQTDGATGVSILGRIQIPMNWPVLLCGAGIVAAMSVADVATSSVVRVPSFSPIAHILIEKFHRFENGMLISLSLGLVVVALPAVLLLTVALRRRLD